ncbi:hypothetical protein MMC22_005287 [Lobaria immixta]|nr:hypothetical protein [Lobaria immixta]
MSRACLSQVPFPGHSPRPCLIKFDFNQEPSTYYLYPKISDVGDDIEISKEPKLTHSPIAKLYIARWTVLLENSSQIQLHAQGWGPEEDSGIDRTSSSLPKGSIVYLRPDDVFQIGHVTLQLQREALDTQGNSKVQVTSSGYEQATTDQQHVHHDGVTKEILESKSGHRHLVSTPHSSHDPDTTIMETPTASRYHIPGLIGSPALSTAAKNSIKDQEDCQKGEPHSNSPNSQANIREGIKGTKEAGLEETIPNPNSEENDHISEEALGEPSISNPLVEELTSEPQKEAPPDIDDEDTQKSTRDRSDNLLDLAKAGQDGLSSPHSHGPELTARENGDIEESSKRSAKPFVEAADLSHQSPPTVTSRQSSRKRKRVTEDTQESMKSMIHVEIDSSNTGARYDKQQSLEEEPAKKGSVRKQSTKKRATDAVREVSEPPSSSKSARSLLHEDSTILRSTNSKLRVFFASSTTVDKTSKFLGFLENHGVTKAKSVKDCDILCIGNNDLRKTCNLVLAVISGKQVVNEDWFVQSVTKGELLDQNGFLARDPVKEAEWETDLSEAIERGKQGVQPFMGFAVHFTPAAKKELGKGFTELKEIAMHAGAKSVQATLPRKSSLAQAPTTIIVALPDDGDLPVLEEGGWRSFNKDIVTLSVLRGSLDVNSNEFLIRHKDGTRSGASKRRKR